MAEVFRIIDRFKITGRGYVYTIKVGPSSNLRLNDVLYDLQENRFRIKGIEHFTTCFPREGEENPIIGVLLEALDEEEVEGKILLSSIEDISFIFCNHPLYPKQVDEDYKEEYQEARLNYSCALFSYEDLEQEDKLSLYGEEISGLTIYRGWMMKPEMYKRFYEKLEDKGIILINSPEEYERYHTLPGWYNDFKEYTPESVWEYKGTIESALDLTIGLSGSYIVKDYVKSRKHEWYDACYIQSITDTPNVKKVVRNFIDRQGKDLLGGVVFRKLVNLKQIGYHEKSGMPISEEYRVFVYAGRVMIIENYWQKDNVTKINDDEFLWIFELIEKIRSNFVTIDLARREDGKLIVMELGDGQVSGLQEIKPERFYPTFAPDYVDESTIIEFSIEPGTVIMAGDPAPDLTIEEVRTVSSKIKSEQELADIFSKVKNKASWLGSDLDDFEDETEEYQKARQEYDEWSYEEHKLREKIFKILRSEGIEIPEFGQITVLSIFMERNGYRDGRGWWVKKG